MIILIVVLKLLVISAVCVKQLTAILKALLILTKRVGVSVVVVAGALVAVRVAIACLGKSWEHILLVVILERIIEWLV